MRYRISLKLYRFPRLSGVLSTAMKAKPLRVRRAARAKQVVRKLIQLGGRSPSCGLGIDARVESVLPVARHAWTLQGQCISFEEVIRVIESVATNWPDSFRHILSFRPSFAGIHI